MQRLEVWSSSTLLRCVVLRNLKMQHLRNEGVMFSNYTHTPRILMSLLFYDLGLYLWKTSESPQGDQRHSLKMPFSISSCLLLNFKTGNLLTDVLNQSCLPDYRRGHSSYERVFYISSEHSGYVECMFLEMGRLLFVYDNEQTRVK